MFLLDVLRVGLGCRSDSYLLYASTSTLAWMIIVSSSILAHHATAMPGSTPKSAARIARSLSIALRRIGKMMAICNAIWLVVLCLLQSSNFLNSCYCNGNVLSLGENAYVVLELLPGDVRDMTAARIGGLVFSTGSVAIFSLFIAIFINHRLPPPNEDR